jgi:hypothetical protein
MTAITTIPEPDVVSLLPGNAGVFERALSAVNVGRLPAQFALAGLVRTLWDPWTIPAAQLPLLAWAWSVDIWNEAWTLDRKRQVVAEARVFHRRKTTVLGYRMALGYVDAELVRARLPRDAFFAGAAPTEASHNAWLAGLPEIRIYTADYTVVARRKGRFLGRMYAGSAARVALGRRRAELHRNGTVQRLVFAGVRIDASGRILADPERLIIPGPRRNSFQAGATMRRRFVPDGKLAGERVIALSFTRGGDVFIPNAMSPGLAAIDAEPRFQWDPQPGGMGLFASGARRRRGVRPNRADEQAYLSIRLADGSSAALGRMRNILGKTRLRRPPFTAALLVHAAGPAKRSFPVTGRFLRAGPEKRIAELMNALAMTQAARDTLFIDLGSTRALTYGDLARLPNDTRAGVAVRVR